MTETLETALSQAADDLRRAAERLTALKARARDEDARIASAEDAARDAGARVAATHAEIAEMEALVEAARSKVDEARSRVAAAEASALTARAEVEAAEAGARDARARLAELEADSGDAVARLASVEAEAREARTRAEDAEAKTEDLEAHSKELQSNTEELAAARHDAEARALELEARAQEVEDRVRELEITKLEAEAQMRELEVARLEAEARAAAAEEQLALDASRNIDLLNVLEQSREARTEAEERARHAEQRLEIAMERGRLLEDEMTDLRAQGAEAEKQPAFTAILDDERTALQEAVASEVRRPLTSILGITLALKHADASTTDGKEMIRQLGMHARKLDRLIGQMIEIDRIASGTFEPNIRRTDIEALVRRVTDESPDLEDREVKLDTQHAAVAVDPAITEQIVEILLSNAGRRTVPGTSVWVRVTPDPTGVTIAVDDTGPEVPPGLPQAMFEAAAHENGSGPSNAGHAKAATGLSLLSRLAGVHGGRCWVEERPGGGASFRVFLPDVAATSPQEPGKAALEERAAASVDADSVDADSALLDSSSLIDALREAMKDDR